MDAELAAALPSIPDLSFADVAAARATFEALMAASPPVDHGEITVSVLRIPGPPGDPEVTVRVFSPPENDELRPAILDVHASGFCIASAAMDDAANVAMARELGVVVVAPEYRLAPENPFPAGVEDCYATLVWLADQAHAWRLDPDRLAIVGDSGGGGIAASTVLLARDRGGPRLAMQALLEPELDDRLQTRSMREGTDTPVWHLANARHSWRHYLGGDGATPYSSPARMEDLSGLPPTYLTVNELDPLRDEGLNYARSLLDAGVSTELHCWPGAFHGFNLVAESAIAQRATGALHDALRRGLGLASRRDRV